MIIEATISGEKQISAELGIVASAVKDWRIPLTESADELMKSFQLNFDARGRLFGGWAPRKREQPWPLLEKTGTLRHSFYSNVGTTQAKLGSRGVDYFKYHQQGTRHLPKRVMLMIDATRRNFILKSFQAHIVNAIKGRK